MSVQTGVTTVGTYATESSFNEGDDTTTASGTPKSVGRNPVFDTFEGVNNGVELFEFGQRLPTQVIAQNFEGNFSLNFVLSTLQFLELYDSVTEDTDSDTNPEYGFEEPESFELVVNRVGSNISRVATGCVAQTLEFDVQVDGTVDVTITGLYAEEFKRTNDDLTQPTIAEVKDSLTFAHTDLNYQSDSLSLPRGVTLTIESDIPLLSVLGSRVAGDFAVGSLTASLTITHAVVDNETQSLESMYGSSTGIGSPTDDNSIEIDMDNGKASGSGQVRAVFTLEGFTESYADDGIDPQEAFVEGSVEETITGLSIEVFED